MTVSVAPTSRLGALAAGVRSAIGTRNDESHTARLVADQLRQHLPGPEVLTSSQRMGDPDGYRAHIVHLEPDGLFSILALVWLPGQLTRIHDHITWCVFGVIQGVEHEELFDQQLRPLRVTDNHPGDVSGFAPPGDIHRVRNIGDTTAISIHIYGADLSRVGSSVRRYYD